MLDVIYYLCPELGNLYGDRFNLTALQKTLSQMGLDCRIKEWGRFDPEPDFSDAALIYSGPVTERRLELLLDALRPFAGRLLEEKKNGTPMLFTGASAELVCQAVDLTDGRSLPALGLAGGRAVRQENRRVGDYLGKMGENIAAGFINAQSVIHDAGSPAFETVFGIPEKTEGIFEDNMLATFLTGPVMVRNPWLRRAAAKIIFARSLPGTEPRRPEADYSDRGYAVTVDELKKRMGE